MINIITDEVPEDVINSEDEEDILDDDLLRFLGFEE